jgi:hypothetical protein
MALQLQPATLTFRFAQRPDYAAYLLADQNGEVHLYAERPLRPLQLRPIALGLSIIIFLVIVILFAGVFGSYIQTTSPPWRSVFVALNTLGCLVSLSLALLPARLLTRERFDVYDSTTKQKRLFTVQQDLTPFFNTFTIQDLQLAASYRVLRRFRWMKLRREWLCTNEHRAIAYCIRDTAQWRLLFQLRVNPHYSIVDADGRQVAQFTDSHLTLLRPIDQLENGKSLLCAMVIASTEDQQVSLNR